MIPRPMILVFPRRPVCLVAVLLMLGAAVATRSAGAAPAQPPAAASPKRPPMIFFLAKGARDACGPGCSEWIAAEGTIDAGAPKRLRTFLNGLGKRKLPIFFHSPGGLGAEAMEMGRILRERHMSAGVSKTVRRGCAAAGDICEASMQTGDAVEADLRNVAVCASACVYVLIGAKVREVPPGARLGVHAAKLLGRETDGWRSAVNARTGRYLREMYIGDGLLDVITSVPHERIHYLSRQQIADFGIDTSDFRESHWTVMEDESSPEVAVEARAKRHKVYQTDVIRLSCAGPGRVRLVHFRSLAPDQTGALRSVELAADERMLSLAKTASVSKLEAMETGGSYEIRIAQGDALDFLEATATRGHIDIIESVSADAATPPRILRLAANGLSEALEKLKRTCKEHKISDGVGTISDGPGIPFLDVRDAPAVKLLGKPR